MIQDMNKTLTKLFTVALLMMVSLGARAQVKVEIEKFDGGTIKERSQTKPDEKGLVTVTITVTPDKGYTIKSSDITVVSTYTPSASTRAPEVATPLTLIGKDPDDLGKERNYDVIVSSTFGIWVKEAKFEKKRDGAKGVISITSLDDISNVASSYKITADIDASGFSTIESFSGTLEAEINPETKMPYRIKNLSSPLFTTLTGTVKNLVLEDVIISGNTDNTGAIACTANDAARIFNVGILSGSVEGTGYTGGLVGLLDGTARVINCYSFANITGGTNVGGIVGYNNQTTTSANNNQKTMVMNCMFYGDITGGNTISPIYGGKIISNAGNNGVGNYNYFRLEAPYVQPTGVTYNCALGAEDRFLQRFEFYRLLLNGHRELAGWWATGTFSSSEMLKWVLETADRTINNPKPYPVLKAQGKYPSIINYDAEYAPTLTLVNGKPSEEDRNKGGKFGTLTVKIQMGNGAVYERPSEAEITTSPLSLNITDKDPDHFNFNYYKVQLPYYNDVGTGNYTGNRVVTGWKIVNIEGGTPGTFTASDTWGGYNFADRNCTNKDLYSVSKRIFNQGAYWDVPEGVTEITIEPYWAKCVYLADPNADKVYNTAMETGYDVPRVGGGQIYTNGNSYSIAGESQVVYTTMGNAISSSNSTGLYVGIVGDPNKQTVYDYAVVLVGNYHHFNSIEASKAKPYTVTSIDLDGDNEPDYSYILRFNSRTECHPVRTDFINMPGLGMAQKSTGGTGSYNFGILIPKGWFESTNTSLFRFTQFEYENSARSETDALIVQGGVMEQWVSYNQKGRSNKIPYIHVGGNVWFKEFHTGCHQDKNQTSGNNRFQPTKHSPISVTGGDFDEFYLTGLYVANAGLDNYADNAECYINGGRFGTVCGAAMEGIGKANGADNTGNISWLIQNADIKEFYAGGLNAAKPVTGNLSTTIVDSHVDIFCGGPKFGDMSAGKTVVTNATGCTFGTFFGAGYGGNSYSRYAPSNQNNVTNIDWNKWIKGQYTQAYNATYGGVSTQFSYQFLPMSDNKTNCARILVDFVKFSLATCRNVTSTLTGCKITGNFYGGGSLGKVDGPVTSTLTNCEVQGNAFGAGFSASLPTVEVDSIGFRTEPYYYTDLGTYRKGVKGSTTTYTWEGKTGNLWVDNTNHILYTDEDLTALGSVTGKATLTINGTTTVLESVYGGGEESGVGGDTEVHVTSGTIGTTGKGGARWGNVFGGGKGKEDDVNAGLVKGNTNVNISQAENLTTTIIHNVYGGGAFGSVGTYTYDTSGNITGYTSGGTANVTITGGTIGTTGKDNGMIFGSSRGDVDEPGSIQDRLAWVHDTHVIIGKTGQDTDAPQPQIKGSIYGSGENGHTYQNTIVDVHSGTIGITSGVEVEDDNGNKYQGAAYPYRGNVYGGGCGTDTYNVTVTEGEGESAVTKTIKKFNPLAGIVQGTTTVNIDGGLVVHNVYGAGAMGSVGTTDNTGVFTSETGTTTINISGGTVGVDGNGNGNVFGAARGDASASKDMALVNTTNVTISADADIKGSVYGGGEIGNVGTYITDDDDNNNYPEGSGVCNVSVTGGTIWHHVFGAGKGAGVTFKCEKAMVSTTSVSMSAGTVKGNVYGGGEVGRVEHNTLVTIGTESGGEETLTINGNVFGAGKGLDTHGYSALVRGNPVVTVQGSAKVGGSVYGGGEIASVGKHSLVTDANKEDHPELEVGMPFTLANTNVGVCTVTVKDKAEITGNVFGAGKGVKPAEISNPGRMKPTGVMEYYNNNGGDNSYGVGWENALRIYIQTLALVTETNVTVGGSATGTATKVKGSVYGGSESGFVQYHTNVDIQDNCEIGTTTTSANVYGGGLGISGNDDAGRVGGNTTIDINGGTMHGSVFGGGAYGIVKGGVDVNINDGIIDQDVYGGGALAHTNTAMWDDTNSKRLAYAEVANLVPESSPVTGYYDESYHIITASDAKAEVDKKYYAIYKTNVNLLGGQLRDAYGGGLGQLAKGSDPAIEAFVYGDVKVELNHNTITTDADGTKKGCIVERLFGCNNLNGTPKGKAQVYVYATQNKNKPDGSDDHIISAKFPKHPKENGFEEVGAATTYDVKAVYGGGNLSPYYPEDADSDDEDVQKAARSEVYIYGCDLTSIKQVYGGGNAAPSPATFVQVNSVYEIEEVFGGGNGHDNYVLDGKTYLNPGANVGYKNYTHPVLNSTTGYYEAVENKAPDYLDATTKENRQANYMYGSGIARLEVYGGRIHASYGGSNEKGNISNIVSSMYDKDGNCTFEVLETYGGGKNSVIDGTIDLDVGCAEDMPQIFGGSKAADVNSDITLRITNGTYGQVFGGNNTSGNVNGSITVIIQESGCKPINIGELYAGGYFAGYSIYGYKEVNGVQVPRTKEDWEDLSDDEKEAEGLTVPRKDPRINVISATQIDEIYGGGYKALVVGNPHVNINMEKGMVIKKYAELMEGYDTAEKDAVGNMILPIGTIGNVYGGGNEADIGGNTYVEIGTGMWLNADDVWETKDADGHTYTYNASTEKWRSGDVDAETAPTPARYTAKITGDVFGGGNDAAVQGNTYVNVCAVNNDDSDTPDVVELISVTLPATINSNVTIGGNIYGGGSLGAVGTYTSATNPTTGSKEYSWSVGGVCNVTINGGTVGPETPTQESPGNVFGAGKGSDETFECEPAMVYKTNVTINNGTVNGTVYGGGEIGRVENNTNVKIGEVNSDSSTPDIKGNVFGAGAGVATHGYSALVRGDSKVTVQGKTKVRQSVYGGGEIATVGRYVVVGGVPIETTSGGLCTVTVQGGAEITGNVFGAGMGITPPSSFTAYDKNYKCMLTVENKPEGAESTTWDYYKDEDGNKDENYVWKYFADRDAYLTFLQTLALASNTVVTIDGSAKVKKNIYGGSESGFVQDHTQVNTQGSCVIGTQTTTGDNVTFTDGNVFGGGKGLDSFAEAGLVKGTTTLNINGGTMYGNVYGGGELGFVGVFTTTINEETGGKVYTWVDGTGICNVTISGGTVGPETTTQESLGNVFGAGKGSDETFECEPAMVDGTIVSISNGTVNGTVYGGGEVGRVNHDTEVTIGLESGTSEPVIKGDVFGAGKGSNTHGYSALVRGKTTVIVQGDAKVEESVYGGGEIASVGSYKIKKANNIPADAPEWVLIGMPYSLQDETSESGKCVVIVRGNAEIGPDGMKMYNPTTGKPDDTGHVFGAGKGVLPFEGVTGDPWRMAYGDEKEYFTDAYYTTKYGEGYDKEEHDYEADYLQFIETLALVTETDVTISGNAFVKGSVYGGSMNGHVQHDTRVTISGGQIGQGKGEDGRYSDNDWKSESLAACDCWDYEANGAPYDLYATKLIDGKYYYDKKDDEGKNISSEGGYYIGTDGHTYYGNVFGGGSGVIPYAPGEWHRAAGSVDGDTYVNITGGHILTNVYGGNEQTDVGAYGLDSNGAPTVPKLKGKCTINITGGTVGVPRGEDAIKALPTIGHVYGAGKGDKRIFFNTWTNVISTEVNITNNARIYGSVFGGGEDGHVIGNALTTIGGTVTIGETEYSYPVATNAATPGVIIGSTGTSNYDGDVFGGGQGSVTALTAGVVGGNVNLNIENGQMLGSVYGGGRLASVGTYFTNPKIEGYGELQTDEPDDHGNIIVNLQGGSIKHNVFGGGMGTTVNTYETADKLGISRNVTVNLNRMNEDSETQYLNPSNKGCIVRGNIFGCNNTNTSPQGNVVVNIYATQNYNGTNIVDKTEGDYDVCAVYGGGNLAPYDSKIADDISTHVNIYGCGYTSIGQVYGGGNAASTPSTHVDVYETYEIDEVFGGGNGKDNIKPEGSTTELPNPGANVGYRDYSAYETSDDVTTGAATKDLRVANYSYGTGDANVTIHGGKVHRVYGGSNTKGNVRISAVTMLEDVTGCEFSVDEAYGGGKSAPMDATSKLEMACIPGLKTAYGGAENAEIEGDVELTITNGTYDRVFGGNNISGYIKGKITVNIEETGCKPLIIGQLYGGGNQAPYTPSTTSGIANGITMNVRSFTSIGDIYGGGYGKSAVVTADTHVNINVSEGRYVDGTYEYANGKKVNDYTGETTIKYTEYLREYDEENDEWGFKYVNGVREVVTQTVPIYLPPFTPGKIGAINKVFGGGNAAPVRGNTNVFIGTKAKELFVTPSTKTVTTGEGDAQTTSVVNTTDEERTVDVKGADIRGNVYGGGNEAEVTGNTNVVIGREATTP